MKLLFVVSVLSLVGLTQAACGGGGDLSPLCGKQQECAEKGGDKFSKTKCESDAKEEAEKANTAGCGDQYSDLASCINGLDFACDDNADKKVLAECGKEVKDYNKCAD